MKWYFFVVSFFLPLCVAVVAQSPPGTKAEIEAANRQIETWYQQKQVDSLINRYHLEITYLPEYKPAIFDKTKLAGFFTDWWQRTTVLTYQKKIYEIQAFGDVLMENGHFQLDYIDTDGARGKYDGMYMIFWKRGPDNRLQIFSEGFCSDKYRKSSEVPYCSVSVAEQLEYPQNPINERLQREVAEANAAVIQAVEAGDSEARIDGFTEDAVYLHHYEKMMVGIKVLRPYLTRVYRPEAEFFVQHKFGRIYDLGDYVLVNGHYKGGWRADGGGTFEGNMLNVRRRCADGKLRIYRSLTNNDR